MKNPLTMATPKSMEGRCAYAGEGSLVVTAAAKEFARAWSGSVVEISYLLTVDQ
jgi:hypothetical protein